MNFILFFLLKKKDEQGAGQCFLYLKIWFKI